MQVWSSAWLQCAYDFPFSFKLECNAQRKKLRDVYSDIYYTHKISKFGKVRQVCANQGIPSQVSWLEPVLLFQIWDFLRVFF